MRLLLWEIVTPSWEDVAPEVAVSSVGNTYFQDTLGQSGHAIHHDYLMPFHFKCQKCQKKEKKKLLSNCVS